MFTSNGELRRDIKKHHQKNNKNNLSVFSTEETKDICSNQKIKLIKISGKDTDRFIVSKQIDNETDNEQGFVQTHGLKIACLTGLLTGGLIGATGAAGIWMVYKAYKKMQKKQDVDTLTEVSV
tara:strand:- start:185 stop:553 length:369 start_codon:yes stop_codon:yes gene_type:complete